MLRKIGYFLRSVRRKGPVYVRRRLEARRSKARLAAIPSVGAEKISVGVLVGGVVGDSIIAARFLRDLAAFCGALTFDVYSGSVAQSRWIFQSVSAIREHFQDSVFDGQVSGYDFALFFSDTVSVRSVNPERSAKFPVAVKTMLERIKGFSHPELPPALAEGFLSQELIFRYGQTRPTASQFLAGIPYGGPAYKISVDEEILLKLNLSRRKYVTVHNGFAVSQATVSKTSTKSYLRFGEAIALVRKAWSDMVFVQVGSITSVPIPGVDLNLLGQTNLKQAAALINGANCHLDNESGFVNMAGRFGVPSCVVYGPSSAAYFTYPGNAEVRPVQCGGCWWFASDWQSRCPRGMDEPVCIRTIPPESVASGLLELLRRQSDSP